MVPLSHYKKQKVLGLKPRKLPNGTYHSPAALAELFFLKNPARKTVLVKILTGEIKLYKRKYV